MIDPSELERLARTWLARADDMNNTSRHIVKHEAASLVRSATMLTRCAAELQETIRQLSARAAGHSGGERDAHRKARELLAAEYDRDGIPFVADCIRTDAMLSQVEERAIRAVVAAMTLRPDHSGGVNKMGVLQQFVRWAITESSFQGCDLDGGEIQGRAVALGLLKEVQVTEPCREECACSVCGFPATCYRFADFLAAAPQPEARNSCKHIHTTQSGDGLHVYCNTCNEDLSPQPEAKP